MHQREPEKLKWYRLQQDLAEQEEGEQEEEQEQVQQEEPEQEVDLDEEPEPEPESELEQEEELDESMQSGTSNELGAHWEESDEWSEG